MAVIYIVHVICSLGRGDQNANRLLRHLSWNDGTWHQPLPTHLEAPGEVTAPVATAETWDGIFPANATMWNHTTAEVSLHPFNIKPIFNPPILQIKK